jgi:hypothetical protein
LERQTGHFIEKDKEIVLISDNQPQRKLIKNIIDIQSTLEDHPKGMVYYLVIEDILSTALSTLNYVYYNLNIMLKNRSLKQVKVNNGTFGKATVFKNFDYDNPILIE